MPTATVPLFQSLEDSFTAPIRIPVRTITESGFFRKSNRKLARFASKIDDGIPTRPRKCKYCASESLSPQVDTFGTTPAFHEMLR